MSPAHEAECPANWRGPFPGPCTCKVQLVATRLPLGQRGTLDTRRFVVSSAWSEAERAWVVLTSGPPDNQPDNQPDDYVEGDIAVRGETVAEALRNAREDRGYSLRDTEKFTGINNATISTLERGISETSFDNVVRLAAAYGLPIAELAGLVEI